MINTSLRQQAKARSEALVHDFFLHPLYERTEKRLMVIAEFVLNCHGDECYTTGKEEQNDHP